MPKTAVNVETVFAAALELPPAQRGAYLAEACGGDERLRERVERLLAAHDDAGRFLDVPAMGPDSTIYAPPLSEKPGTVIGRYKLLEQVGEGGFGVVFMAEQEEPVRRKVALKIIKPGMDSKEVIARFEAEEQALALMDHPNIARVLDAGATDSGRPYFVMELVRGKPITDYCDECDLPPDQRLQLFVSVCHAVQHAHQKGIIHRDLKPSNVLVTLHDGEPVVKVIDFGVAKAINQRLTEKTLFTRFAQMVGTPLYMSPEQAEMSGLDVDTRTDIYSLGVLLYELLTGSTPFDRKRLLSAGYDEIRRIIREEEPVKPSTKISTQRELQTTGSSRRHIDRKRLSAILRGDLDWIVMKALEKDRRRRYETAKDFASDIQRFLNHEAVEATPPSVVYRVRKFVRRHRVGVAATAATGVFVVVIAAVAWKSLDDRKQRELADLRARNAGLQAEMDRANAEADRLARAEADRKRDLAEKHAANLKWLNDEFFPSTERLKADKQWAEAFAQAQKAANLFPQDPRVHQVWQETSCRWTVTTDPPGARILARPYGDAAAEWAPVGMTPLDRVTTARGFYHWKIERDGFRSAEGCAGPEVVELKLALDTEDPATADMVHVAASLSEREVDVFIDRHEVTNREFKRFVDRGKYAEPTAWRYDFYEDGKQLPRDQAMARLVDSTGKPGPSTWANGTYPSGEDNLPVRGISWYEAAAYAGWVNKSLPTIYDWQLASGANLADYILPVSNYSPAGPVAEGSRPSVGPFGTYDMAGNVREWCFNEGDARQRYILGGAWDEPAYMFNQSVAQSAMDRSETNGFRCAYYVTPPASQLMAAVIPDYRDYTKERPVSDSQFETIRRPYAYASKPLNAQVSLAEETERYRHEVITFDATYGNELVTAHLFLPRRGRPPFQTVVYFPGADAGQVSTFYTNAFARCNASFVVATGRAVLWPVYRGHFERRETRPLSSAADRIQLQVQQVHDLRAAVDYLYERNDIDRENLAYFGSSNGARLGPIMLAMEDRFKVGILLVGGFSKGKFAPPPELDPFHFAPHVKIPVLMINGRMDDIFPYQVSQLPMLNALGTSSQDKRHSIFPGGHSVAPEHVVDESLVWLDRYLGDPAAVEETTDGTPLARAQREIETGTMFLSWQKYAEAEKRFQNALGLLRPALGPEHPDILRAKTSLARAIAPQGRQEEAIALFEETLAAQRRLLGSEHADTLATTKLLCEILRDMAWKISGPGSTRPKEDQARAAQLMRKVAETSSAEARHWMLSMALFRQGEYEASREALMNSLATPVEDFPGQWLLAAVIEDKTGNPERARDWYAAGCQRCRKNNVTSGPLREWQKETANLLNLPLQGPPGEWTTADRLASFDRLIAQYGNAARLYEFRGACRAALGQWDEAIADYGRAVELDPAGWRAAEARTAIVLYARPLKEQTAACRELIARFKEYKNPNGRMDLVLLCSLADKADLDRAELRQLATTVLTELPSRFFLQIGLGMAEYRTGNFEAALTGIPTTSDEKVTTPKNDYLALLFRAMAHCQLGDKYTCRKLLDTAREGIEQNIPTPDGEMLPYQERPVEWCMIQTALREAETLIEGKQDAPAPAVPAAAIP